MGRTGRKRDGRIVVLVTQGKEEQMYKQSVNSKKQIHKAIVQGNQFKNLYPSNPRMLPPGVNPTCLKMHMKVEKYNAPGKCDGERTITSALALVKRSARSKGSALLSMAELEYWNENFKLPDHQIPALQASTFVTLPDRRTRGNNNTERPGLSLSEWIQWQDTPQSIYKIEHSSRTMRLVEIMQFIELQEYLGPDHNTYDMEMAAFLNVDDVMGPPVAVANTKHSKTNRTAKPDEDLSGPDERPAADLEDDDFQLLVADKGKDRQEMMDFDDDAADFERNERAVLVDVITGESADIEVVPPYASGGHEPQETCEDINRNVIKGMPTDFRAGLRIEALERYFETKEPVKIKPPPPSSELFPLEKEQLSPVDIDAVIKAATEEVENAVDMCNEDFPAFDLDFETKKDEALQCSPMMDTNRDELDLIAVQEGNEASAKLLTSTPHREYPGCTLNEPKRKFLDADFHFSPISSPRERNLSTPRHVNEASLSRKRPRIAPNNESSVAEDPVSFDLDTDVDKIRSSTPKSSNKCPSSVQQCEEDERGMGNWELEGGDFLADVDVSAGCDSPEKSVNDGRMPLSNKGCESSLQNKGTLKRNSDGMSPNKWSNSEMSSVLFETTLNTPEPTSRTNLESNSLITSGFATTSTTPKLMSKCHRLSRTKRSLLSTSNLPLNSSATGAVPLDDSADDQFKSFPSCLASSVLDKQQVLGTTANQSKYGVTQLLDMIDQPTPCNTTSRKSPAKESHHQKDTTPASPAIFEEIASAAQPEPALNFDLGFDLDVASDDSDEDPIPPSPPHPPLTQAFISTVSRQWDSKLHADSVSFTAATSKDRHLPANDTGTSLPIKLNVGDTKVNCSGSRRSLLSLKSKRMSVESPVKIDVVEKFASSKLRTPVALVKPHMKQQEINTSPPVSDQGSEEITGRTSRNQKKQKKCATACGGEQYLLREADVPVADVAVSSDEDELAFEDNLDPSFIDDEDDTPDSSVNESAPVDMQAVYLRSVTDVVNHRDGFKLRYDYNKDLPVCSQSPVSDDDDYELDSFCVANDDDSPDKKVSHRRNKSRWRRIVVGNSSSEEGSDPCGTSSPETGAVGSTSNPIDCDRDSDPEEGRALATTSARTTRTSQVQENLPPSNSQSLFKVPCDPVGSSKLYNAKPISPNSPLQNATNATLAAVNSSWQAKLELKRRQLERREEYQRKLSERMLNQSLTNSHSSHSVVGSTSPLTGSPNAGTKGPSNKHILGQKVAMPLHQGKLLIFVDSKGIGSSQAVVSALRRKHDTEIVVESLTAADYIVSNRMGVCRHSLKDVGNPQKRPGLVDRIQHLCELFDRPSLILEYERGPQGDAQAVNRSKYLDTILSYLSQTYIKVLYSDSPDQTAQLIADLAVQERRKNNAIQVPLPFISRQMQNSVISFYLSLPHVSTVCALNLAHGFPTIQQFVHSSPKKVEEVGRMSQGRAVAVHDYVRHRYIS